MLQRLKDYLDKNNIAYKITYGGSNNDIENVEVDVLAILEDKDQYEVCHIPSANFIWLDFEEVVGLIADYVN